MTLCPSPQFAIPDTPCLVLDDGAPSLGESLHCARDWAAQLPRAKYLVLLCERRSHFILGFLAAQMNGMTVLLPPSRAPGAIREILDAYPDSACLVDDGPPPAAAVVRNCRDFHPIRSARQPASGEVSVPPEHVAAIVFTSGSTGRPRPNPKTWASLVHGARLAIRRFGFDSRHCIIATVPPQHMYGLETSVMLPLHSGARVHGGLPFYPEDIRLALERCPGRRVLVTTPIHLRACVSANLDWPAVERIISATAPLDKTLAAHAEDHFKAPVMEIYGCTEAGSLASRHTTQEDDWLLYDDFQMTVHGEHCRVTAAHLAEEVELADVIQLKTARRFELLGRHADHINLAGKRASLADLTARLTAIPGVVDGAFLELASVNGATTRMAALVVAPGISEARILERLREQIDPVFLPRPLVKVASLPRNATGKLPRTELLELYERQVMRR